MPDSSQNKNWASLKTIAVLILWLTTPSAVSAQSVNSPEMAFVAAKNKSSEKLSQSKPSGENQSSDKQGEWFDFTIKYLAILGPAIWAFWTYLKNNRIKSAELLLSLETNFRTLIPTTIELDSDPIYRTIYEPAILRANKENRLQGKDLERLAKVDAFLRHLMTCKQLQSMGAHPVAIRESYIYWIDLINSPRRKSLRKYVKKYWKMLDQWVSSENKM